MSLGITPPTSVQAIVFAAMFSGAVSMNETDTIRDFGAPKAGLVDSFRMGTETALGRANVLKTTKLETLQVSYLVSVLVLTSYNTILLFFSFYSAHNVSNHCTLTSTCHGHKLTSSIRHL